VPTSGHRSSGSFTVVATRRDWSPSEKRTILAEMAVPGANVSAIARRHGVAQSLLYRWRKDAAAAERGAAAVAPAFVPVAITALPPPVPALVPAAPSLIEIVLVSGRVVRAGVDVDAGKLAAIIAALEGPSETGA
jgi:transposase